MGLSASLRQALVQLLMAIGPIERDERVVAERAVRELLEGFFRNGVVDRDGSVQHLDFLSEQEKEVFKTFCEIDQIAIVDQAAARQQFIDQGQSLNLMINPKTPTKDINKLYLFAWEAGIKTLYYQHSTNAAQQFNQAKMCVGACEA